MDEITGANKMMNGVLVEYRRGGLSQIVGFTYEDLIAMEINVLDLIEHPRDYEVDPEGKAIFPCPSKCQRPPAR
ncbi:hypothetical protein [uncultured Methanofollis sp.]|uniref:hypothetical protein n=1 Tax=uncultured Methanofollis sp. TaxID=262500 RepID=UPI00261C59D0|nr:hypothetical protein [uncultured Methanofollis sp.]